MSAITIVGDVVEHVVITDAERTSEGDGPAFNKAAIKILAAFNEAVGRQDVRRAVDYHLVMVAEGVESPIQVIDRSERARRPTEILRRMPKPVPPRGRVGKEGHTLEPSGPIEQPSARAKPIVIEGKAEPGEES